jgi:hypothetical protein
MLSLAEMSPSEVQFVRLYVTTLRREYVLLKSVLDLMHPDNLGVKSFTDATRMALGLAEMQQDFDGKIRRIQKQHSLRTMQLLPSPSLDELANLFSLSFFKLVTTATLPAGVKYNNEGWFSGKPTEWKKTLLQYKDVPKGKTNKLPDLLTDFFTAALKFFPFDNNKWLTNKSNVTKKIWPPETKNWGVDDDEIEDDSFDFDPFDWLFGDDED